MTETAAIVTFNGPQNWSQFGRMMVADWLRQVAEDLEDNGHNMAKKYRARYLYSETEDYG